MIAEYCTINRLLYYPSQNLNILTNYWFLGHILTTSGLAFEPDGAEAETMAGAVQYVAAPDR